MAQWHICIFPVYLAFRSRKGPGPCFWLAPESYALRKLETESLARPSWISFTIMCLKTTQHFVPTNVLNPSFPCVQPIEWDCVWRYCWRQWMPACSHWVQITLLYLISCLQGRRRTSSSLSSIIMRYVISLSFCIVDTPACILFIIHNSS